jgi:excisionase family DNA binding protein
MKYESGTYESQEHAVDLISIGEAARRLDCPKMELKQAIQARHLHALQFGERWFTSAIALDDYSRFYGEST